MGNEGMNIIPDDVYEKVENYLKRELPQYKLIDIRRKSNHPDDNHLYQVIAKKDVSEKYRMFGMREFTVWTCWNNKTESLNYGHYNIGTLSDAHDICDKYYHRAY